MRNNKRIYDTILDGINSFISDEFFPKPYHYLYENDIQSALFCILRSKVNEGVSIPNKIYSALREQTRIDTFNLNLINSEYAERIDLVCLDPERPTGYEEYARSPRMEKHTKPLDRDPLYDQPLLVGIEVKSLPAYQKESILTKCRKDRTKLEKYQKENVNYSPHFQYLAISFFLWDFDPKDIDPKNDVLEKRDEIKEFDRAYIVGGNEIFVLAKC